MTVVWHIEDLKISQDPEEVTAIIAYPKSIYGKITVKHGKKHTYLGMEIVLSNIGQAKICMGQYIDEAVEEFTEDVSTPVSSPASDHILKTRKGKLLPEDQALLFHCLLSELLFVSNHARPDIQSTIYFLSTHVHDPNKYNWKNIRQLLQYLNGTRDMCLMLNTKDLNIVQSWVDAEYGVCDELKGHTEAIMPIRKSSVTSISTKHRINTTGLLG